MNTEKNYTLMCSHKAINKARPFETHINKTVSHHINMYLIDV